MNIHPHIYRTDIFRRPGPRLMTDTQHSTLHVFEWGSQSMECEIFHTQDSPFKYMELSLEFKEWSAEYLGPSPKLMTHTQHSTLRSHTPHSGFPHSNTLRVECGVLSIRHNNSKIRTFWIFSLKAASFKYISLLTLMQRRVIIYNICCWR